MSAIAARPDAELRLLAVASKGGHWEQMMLMRPALARFDTCFATTDRELARRDGLGPVRFLPDANGDRPLAAVRALAAACLLIVRTRPDVVLSTGALPGLWCILIGRLAGARTIWLDSFANSEKLSRSGRWARRLADHTVTQWEYLADKGAEFHGRLL